MDDKNIIDLFWERNESAISKTSVKYGKLCKSVALNILNNSFDAEECVNDTYLKAWQLMPTERPKFLSAFLCKITKNFALKKYEYYSASKRKGNSQKCLDEIYDYIVDNKNVYDKYEADYIAERINAFLKNETPDNRKIFVKRYWFFDQEKDIAECFGISQSKVKSSLFRTRKKLKEQLEREGLI